jgi:hypothetical protein
MVGMHATQIGQSWFHHSSTTSLSLNSDSFFVLGGLQFEVGRGLADLGLVGGLFLIIRPQAAGGREHGASRQPSERALGHLHVRFLPSTMDSTLGRFYA